MWGPGKGTEGEGKMKEEERLRGMRQMYQVLPKQMCHPPKGASLQPCWQGVLPEEMEGWRDTALGGQLQPTGSCVCDQAEATSPASQKPWVVGGLHQEGLSNQLRSGEKQQLCLLPLHPGPSPPLAPGPEALCYPHQSVVLGVSPAFSLPFTHCFRRAQSSGEGGAEEFSSIFLLALCRKNSWGPSWGKVI